MQSFHNAGMLSGLEIVKQVEQGNIKIDPFRLEAVNPNSYNLRLGPKIMRYKRKPNEAYLDSHRKYGLEDMEVVDISDDGIVLLPGILYLGATIEMFSTDKFVPKLDGRSSTGRFGLDVHKCAGVGDIGFAGTWTLELEVIEPLKIYAGDEICQMSFYTVCGEIDYTYKGRYKYQIDPVQSKLGDEKDPDSLVTKYLKMREGQQDG